MDRTTFDFGIDLGTTNSAVAVLKGVVPDIVKNNLDMDTTPSAVYIGRQGQVQVGARAKNRQEVETAQDDVYMEFKRRMGTDHTYRFGSAGIAKRPEDLSAEILKSLREDVRQRTGEEMRAAVITIPAMFEQRQCNATKQAGERAGFSQTALLQEPVAASLAYGFQKEVESRKSFWLIFDFGGGTFDAAVMKAEDGDITVINHGGDNFLGGADIDWGIVEQLIVPQLTRNYALSGFQRGEPRWRAAFAKIKRAVEEAKIQLSRSETAFLERCVFMDTEGTEIDLDGMKLTRGEVIGVAEPLIVKACDISKKVLKEKSMAVGDIGRVLLVGGPTLAPYFREIVSDQLGVSPDFSVDPLTVVARGAAVFAGTQRIDQTARRKAAVAAGKYSVALSYTPVGVDEDPRVAGEVTGTNGTDGLTVEFVNRISQWRSGKIPLRDGKFSLRLLAEAGERNTFDILLIAADGSGMEITPNSLDYTIGATVKAQVVPNDIAVVTNANTCNVLVAKGTEYPFKKTNRDFHSSVRLGRGKASDVLCIPVVEGSLRFGDCNKHLGSFKITGTEVSRDLPAGSDIEVTLEAKEPGSIKVTVYIPTLDQEFSVVLDYDKKNPGKINLKNEFEKERKRAHELDMTSGTTASLVLEIADKLKAANDPEAANQAQNSLLKLRLAINEEEERRKWPELEKDAEYVLARMSEKLKAVSSDALRKAQDIKDDIDRAGRTRNAEDLSRALQKAHSLIFDLDKENPEFWKGILQSLYQNRSHMQNRQKAEELLELAAQAIHQNDVDKMSKLAVLLFRLLPQEDAEQFKGAFGSGIE